MRLTDFYRAELSEKERRNIEIMEILRRRGPLSRPEISKEIGINVVTISNYVDDFIKSKLVYEKELDYSQGGRRPELLDLNPQGGYVIGVGLNLMNMVGVLVDLKGNIITKTQVPKPGPSVRDVAGSLLDIVREILRRSKEYTADIRGIGIGIAGLIHKKSGSVHWPQKSDGEYIYASVDVPLRDLFQKEFSLPVLIENDANCACFGEYWLGLEDSFKNIIYMISGAGCGIMINGDIYTGMHGYAGEVTIHSHNEKRLSDCPLGTGCLMKRWEIDLGVIEDMKALLAKDKNSADNFYKSASVSAGSVDLKTIFSANRAQDPLASSVLEKGAERLGIKIAYLVNLLNPEAVIIGGGWEDAGESFLNKITATVRQWAFREAVEDLRIIYSQLRENAVAMGAASLVTQRIFAGIL